MNLQNNNDNNKTSNMYTTDVQKNKVKVCIKM